MFSRNISEVLEDRKTMSDYRDQVEHAPKSPQPESKVSKKWIGKSISQLIDERGGGR